MNKSQTEGKKVGKSFKEALAELLLDKEFAKEYCIPHFYDLNILRNKAGLTQKQLANKIGTKQPAISRIEETGLCTLSLVGKIAYALGYVARLTFKPLSEYSIISFNFSASDSTTITYEI